MPIAVDLSVEAVVALGKYRDQIGKKSLSEAARELLERSLLDAGLLDATAKGE